MNRRSALKAIALLAGSSSIPLLYAKVPTPKIFIWITLRGALDGLHAVPPTGDPNYYKLRPNLALNEHNTFKLDELFSLHSSLSYCHSLYEKKELLIFHAVSTSYRKRSHFDGQKVLENGTSDPNHLTGWLNRYLSVSQHKALAIDPGIPLILQGDTSAASWYPNKLKTSDAKFDRLATAFTVDPELYQSLMEARNLNTMSGNLNSIPHTNFAKLCKQVGVFANHQNGPNIFSLELGGWDTHSSQTGRLSSRLKVLDRGIRQLKASIGTKWKDTVVVIATEFGRTAKENGTKGTDHGTGGAAFVTGGAVQGGKVIAQWPGLEPDNLYQMRDLKPTQSLNEINAAILVKHLGLPNSQLSKIFPDSQLGDISPLMKYIS